MKEVTGCGGKIKSVITRRKGVVAGTDGKPVDADVEIPVKQAEDADAGEKKEEKKED